VRCQRCLGGRQGLCQLADHDVGVQADRLDIGADERARVEAGRQAREVPFLDLLQVCDPNPGPAADFGQAQPLGHPGLPQFGNRHPETPARLSDVPCQDITQQETMCAEPVQLHAELAQL
jgi:hypothetical protein